MVEREKNKEPGDVASRDHMEALDVADWELDQKELNGFTVVWDFKRTGQEEMEEWFGKKVLKRTTYGVI